MTTPLRPGQGEQIALEALTKAGRHGLNTQQVADHLRTTRNRAGDVLSGLVKAGRVQRQWAGGRSPARWWIAGQGPKVETVSTAPRTSSQPPRRITLDPSVPAINPHGVQPVVCPCGQDTRFVPDPRVAGRGAITQDWRERRLQGVRA